MSDSTTPDQLGLLDPVPDDFRGVWQRTLLQTDLSAGEHMVNDSTTWVRWLQTSLWHGHLSVPQHIQHDRPAHPLSALLPSQLGALTEQNGFTGITKIASLPEGLVCKWLHRVDYQPPSVLPDAGWMLGDRPGHLIEIGVHAEYNATWELLPDSTERFIALAGVNQRGQDDGSRIMVAGRYLMCMRPRVKRWPRGMTPGYTLTDVMLTYPELAMAWLDCEVSFGVLTQGHWHIERSTLPDRENQQRPFELQRLGEGRAQLMSPDMPSDWQILEWTADGDRITA